VPYACQDNADCDEPACLAVLIRRILLIFGRIGFSDSIWLLSRSSCGIPSIWNRLSQPSTDARRLPAAPVAPWL
jgi:hypothetical protein